MKMPGKICWRLQLTLSDRLEKFKVRTGLWGSEDKMQNKNDDEIEIDLQELLAFLLHWLWMIILCGVLTAAAALLISSFVITPLYQSTTKVYILNKQENNNNITYSDVQLGTVLTKDYAQMITSRTVLEQVIANCALQENYEQLADKVTVENVSDTRIIAITVKDPDPVAAQLLANEVREIASEQITNVMDIQAVNVVDMANLPEKPYSPKVAQWTLIGLLLGCFVCAAVLTVRFLMDDTIKSSEDVEKYLGLSTLAMIPVAEDAQKHKGRRSKKGEQTQSGKGGAVNAEY